MRAPHTARGDAVARQDLEDAVADLGLVLESAPPRVRPDTAVRLGCVADHTFDVSASAVLKGAVHCPRCAKFRHDIDDMRALAKKQGGECLSDVYRGTLEKLVWRCRAGHTFLTTPNTVIGGSWCKACNVGMHSIDDLRAAASRIGATLLTTARTTGEPRVDVRCPNGHHYRPAIKRLVDGHGCPRCCNAPTVEDMRASWRKRGLELLATEYRGTSVVYPWRCRKGHVFERSISRLSDREPYCTVCEPLRPRRTLEDLQTAAKKRGGSLVSTAYRGVSSRYRWRCAKGHEWRVQGTHVIRGKSWCPECSASRRHTIGEMQALARERGGACLSRRYVKSRAPLRWSCAEGHTFERTPDEVVRFRVWCPVCEPENTPGRASTAYYASRRARKAKQK